MLNPRNLYQRKQLNQKPLNPAIRESKMKPVEFPEQNCIYAKSQKEYLPLPAYEMEDGTVISCWKVSWAERIKILINGKIWLSILTFLKPLQPQRMQVESPFSVKEVKEKPHAYLCFRHGGSDACEKSNLQYGFKCPRCVSENTELMKNLLLSKSVVKIFPVKNGYLS